MAPGLAPQPIIGRPAHGLCTSSSFSLTSNHVARVVYCGSLIYVCLFGRTYAPPLSLLGPLSSGRTILAYLLGDTAHFSDYVDSIFNKRSHRIMNCPSCEARR